MRIFKNTKNPNYLNVGSTSDIHQGHDNTPSENITASIENAFPRNEETAALDMILIPGDFFDKQLELPSKDKITEATAGIAYLLSICSEYDIVLRVLEGTPSHDYKQGYLFEHFNRLYGLNCDVKYVSKLDVEHIERFGLDVLYIPDEWSVSEQDTLNQVKELLRAKGLKQVDIALMHGAFAHQYPPNLQLPTHDLAEYSKLVKYYIFIGHVHHYSVLDKAISAGSLTRLAHGEENPKGHVRVKIRSENLELNEIKFVENPLAYCYKTFDYSKLSYEDIESRYPKDIQSLPKGAYVAIKGYVDDPIKHYVKTLRLECPDQFIKFSPIKVKKDRKGVEGDPLAGSKRAQSVDLNPESLARLLRSRIVANPNYESRVDDLMQALDEYL